MLMVAGDYHPISYPGALDSGELKRNGAIWQKQCLTLKVLKLIISGMSFIFSADFINV